MKSTGKLANPSGLRFDEAVRKQIIEYQNARRLEKFSAAARELLTLGIEASRGDTAQILDAARLLRDMGRDPLVALRTAAEAVPA